MLEGTKKVVFFSIVVAALFSYYLAHCAPLDDALAERNRLLADEDTI